MRGISLEQDLRLLINNPKYSDLEILCNNGVLLFGNKAILAARSELFETYIFGSPAYYVGRLTFSNIHSSIMEIILEYIYSGSLKKDSITKYNIVEVFFAADYLQLPNLRDFVVKTLKNANYKVNYSPDLLSRFAEIAPLTQIKGDNNLFLNELVDSVALTRLNTINLGRLSIKGLQYLLSSTFGKEKPFVTPEYEVFRYSAILAAKRVSNDAYYSISERLPTMEQAENPTLIENNFEIYQKKVAEELEPLLKYIDFKRMNGQMLTDIIEPLGIIPSEIIMNVYRYMARLKLTTSTPKPTPNEYIWDKSACGSELTVEEYGKVVEAQLGCGYQNVRAKMVLDEGIYEWDVIIERYCEYSWIGVCSPDYFNYEECAGKQPNGWVLCSNGYCCNDAQGFYYCPVFKNDAKITVRMDMNKKTITFTVNGVKYSEITIWKNFPSKLYPVVSLSYPGRFRIEPTYQKL